jgi:hypothetical protein
MRSLRDVSSFQARIRAASGPHPDRIRTASGRHPGRRSKIAQPPQNRSYNHRAADAPESPWKLLKILFCNHQPLLPICRLIGTSPFCLKDE